MPEFYKVIWDGHTLFKGFDSEEEAYAKAEKWQVGMCKYVDKRDHFEVVRDRERERAFDEDYDRFKRGLPQRYIYQMEV